MIFIMNKSNAKKTSLKDIAEAAGVSVSAVSQILNGREINFCSEAKKAKVKAVASELNYQPNFGYQLLHGITTNTIGIICSTPRNEREEHMQLLQLSLMRKIEQKNYAVYVSTMTEDEEWNLKTINNLAHRGCSAFIFIGCPVGFKRLENFVIENGARYLSFGVPDFRRNISIDTGLAVKEYIEYLKGKGKTDFVFIGGAPNETPAGSAMGIFRSFPEESHKKLLAKYYRQITKKYIFDIDFAKASYDIGFEMTAALLRERADIQAVIYENDYLAVGGIYAILKAGRKPGEDILVRGYNNTNAGRFFPYPFSSVDNDVENICNTLLRELFTDGPLNLILKPKLVIRELNKQHCEEIS